MLLGFKKRFAPFVGEGSKTHTIRARRSRRPRVGEICHCYTGLRQKGARLLGRFVCANVQSIYIGIEGHVRIEGVPLDGDSYYLTGECAERNALAWADGFRTNGKKGAFREMLEYWINLGHSLPFEGDIIFWKFKEGTCVPNERASKPRARRASKK